MIYFITCRAIHAVKIGYSDNVAARLTKMQSDCPLPLKLEAVIEGDICSESELHRAFSDLRLKGEWFHIGPSIETAIEAGQIPTDTPSVCHPEIYPSPSHTAIIARNGGPAAIGRLIGIDPNTTKAWKRLDSIPAAHWQSLANAGAASLDELAAAAARTPKQGAAV